MTRSFYQILLYVFMAEHIISYFASFLVVARFRFEYAEEKRRTLLLSVPILLTVDTFLLLVVGSLVFSGRSIPQELSRIFSGNISFQDISRFAVSGSLCLLLSMLVPVIVGVLYNRRNGASAVGKRLKAGVLLSGSIIAVLLILGCYAGAEGTRALSLRSVCRRTELAVSGEATSPEGYGYVILHNNAVLSSEEALLYLSVDSNAPTQIPLRDVTIPAGESRRFAVEGGLNLRRDGGSVLYLNDRYGRKLDSVMLPALATESVYMLQDGAWELVTRKDDNAAPFVSAPVFVQKSGFYEKSFDLEISARPGLSVYYTVDSSVPDEHSRLYKGSILISDRSPLTPVYRAIRSALVDPRWPKEDPVEADLPQATVIRAVAVDAEGNRSKTVTATYFVGLDEYRSRAVISLVSDPEGLFGDEGIYVGGPEFDSWYKTALSQTLPGESVSLAGMPVPNYEQHGMEWERPAYFQLFGYGSLITEQDVGIRIQGNSHRWLPQKRFSVYARNEYSGSDYFDMAFTDGRFKHSYMLREGDSFAVCQRLGAGRDVETVDFVPVTVFLDGELWYETRMYEKFDERNLAVKYGLTHTNIEMIKNGAMTETVNDGANPITGLLDIFKEDDLSLPESYARLCSTIDIQSYIDYMCLNVYCANMDYREDNNVLLWHTAYPSEGSRGDTLWRWGLFDMDLNWGTVEDYKEHSISSFAQLDPFTMHGPLQTISVSEMTMFSALRQNEDFNRQFVLTFADMLNTNLSPENVQSVLYSVNPKDGKVWDFFRDRNKYIYNIIAKEFVLSGARGALTLTSNAAEPDIRLNTVRPELTEGKWTGSYFVEFPVTLSTDDPSFVRWEVTSRGKRTNYSDRELELVVEKGGVQVNAIFR